MKKWIASALVALLALAAFAALAETVPAVDDDLDTAVCELKDIIIAEHAKVTHQNELLEKLQSELGGEK